MNHLISLVETDLSKVVHEVPARQSRFRKAGSPTCCQNSHCKHLFERACIRGDDDRYYCSEICAQVGLGIDLAKVVTT